MKKPAWIAFALALSVLPSFCQTAAKVNIDPVTGENLGFSSGAPISPYHEYELFKKGDPEKKVIANVLVLHHTPYKFQPVTGNPYVKGRSLADLVDVYGKALDGADYKIFELASNTGEGGKESHFQLQVKCEEGVCTLYRLAGDDIRESYSQWRDH
jgi:hypothetical protein